MKKIRKGDNVLVMRGKDAGKQGEVTSYLNSKVEGVADRVIVKGVNIVKRSQKPNPQLGIIGGINEMEKSIDVSNVMLIDPKSGKPSRVGFSIDEKTGKKVRILKKSGQQI